MCCAQDVGMAVNPDQLKAQIESNMAWSVGMALLERLEVGHDTIRSSNFDDYPIVRMQDMPSVDADHMASRAGNPYHESGLRDAEWGGC